MPHYKIHQHVRTISRQSHTQIDLRTSSDASCRHRYCSNLFTAAKEDLTDREYVTCSKNQHKHNLRKQTFSLICCAMSR